MEDREGAAVVGFFPDPAVAERFHALLLENGFTTLVSSSRGAALEKIALYSPSLILTEVFMDDVSAQDWLRAIRAQSDAAIVIVSRQPERRTGQDRRLGTIFEYLANDCQAAEFIGTVKRALEFYETRNRAVNYARESRKRMLAQLEWLIWKQSQRVNDRREDGLLIIHSIKHSLTQGIGLGSLITQVHFLEMVARQQQLSSEHLAPLLNSAGFLMRWLENLDQAQELIKKRYDVGVLEPEDIDATIDAALEDLKELIALGGHRLERSNTRPPFALQGNPAALRVCLCEMLLNALKFSAPESVIQLAGHRMGNSFGLLTLSDVVPGPQGGIPAELEQVIFQPFTKLNSVFDERYANRLPGLGLGLGIGLNLVQTTLSQVGARAQVYQVSDHSPGNGPRSRVVAEILMPFVVRAEEGLVRQGITAAATGSFPVSLGAPPA